MDTLVLPARPPTVAGVRQPVLVQRAPMNVVGLRYVGHNRGDALAELWHQLILRVGDFGPTDRVNLHCYGVCRQLHGSSIAHGFEYMAGVEALPGMAVPPGMTSWGVPGGVYAEVRAANVDDVRPATAHFYRCWLPEQDDLCAIDGPSLEYYGEAFPQNPTVMLYFPVAPGCY